MTPAAFGEFNKALTISKADLMAIHLLSGTKIEMEEFEQWYMTEETSSDSDEATCSLFDSGEWRDLMQAEFSNVAEQKNKEKSTDKMSREKMKMSDVDVVYETVDEATNVQGVYTHLAVFILFILQHVAVILLGIVPFLAGYEQQTSGEDSENVSPNIGDSRRTEDAGGE